jgi:hypothetical protein
MWTSAKYHLFMAIDWKLHPNSFPLEVTFPAVGRRGPGAALTERRRPSYHLPAGRKRKHRRFAPASAAGDRPGPLALALRFDNRRAGLATAPTLAPAQQPQIQVRQTPPLFKQVHRIIDVDVDPPVIADSSTATFTHSQH